MAEEKIPGVTRQEFLADRDLEPCPFHEACTADWGVAHVEYDVCAHERNGTVSVCPSLVQEGGELAYQSVATTGE